MSLFERLREGHWTVRYGDEVYVIRHKAVAQQRNTVKLRILAEQLQIGNAVALVGENYLASISALRNMMRNVDDHHAGKTSHDTE